MSRYIDADIAISNIEKTFIGASEFATDTRNAAIDAVNQAPTADVQEVVRCKDCVYWQGKKVKMEDGTLRDYTPEEIIEGYMVDISKGINLGSRCLRNQSGEENSFPVWCNENDFCSHGAKIYKR